VGSNVKDGLVEVVQASIYGTDGSPGVNLSLKSYLSQKRHLSVGGRARASGGESKGAGGREEWAWERGESRNRREEGRGRM